MKLYVQLMILFVISLIGEGISSFFHLLSLEALLV